MKEQIEKILNADDAFTIDNRISDMYVIFVNGKRIKTLSGKSVWSGIGSAKKALKAHINKLLATKKFSIYGYKTENGTDPMDWDYLYGLKNKTIDNWIKDNVVYVPYEEYTNAVKKQQE